MAMRVFNLTDDEVSRLTAKFGEFKEARDNLFMFIVRYIADYQEFHETPSRHRRYLRRKYSWQTPRINYLFNSEDGFYWSVRNIAIVLGRDRSSITRIINKMKQSSAWCERLSTLQKSIRSESCLDINVYHQDIFELLFDYYEEEYLLRFAEPRHGGKKTSPDIDELHRFWNHLKAMESIQKMVFVPNNFEMMLLF